jgi:hypothetical protein
MKINYFIVMAVMAVIFFIPAVKVFANVQYPVAELGGCKNEADCKAYCDKEENKEFCFEFARKNNLMTDQEIKAAEKLMSGKLNGPGGCDSKESCEAFCNSMDVIDECVEFAEKNNLLPSNELEEIKKVQSALKRGVKAPPCKSKTECDAYCEDPSHMEECITFGAEAGFLQGKELEDAQKMLQAIKKGAIPPPCRGKEDCDEYCNNPDNMEKCMTFAMEAGFMSEQEKADSQKMLQALKKGVKPPNCKGKEGCDVYCNQEEHFEECMSFAEAAGFMSAEDAVMARKTGGKGPGGCKGKEECEAFCANPDNQETCFNFGRDNGLIPEEDLKKMEEGKQQMRQGLEQAPAEVIECLNSTMGQDAVEKMKAGTAMPSRDMGDKMQNCFQQNMGPRQGENQNMQGPAVCNGKSPEECKFRPGPGVENPGGQMMPQQAGPGGCKSPEECKSYCESNPGSCKNSYPAGDEDRRTQEQRGPNMPGTERGGQMPQIQPCQGENCQQGPMPGQQMYPMQPGQEIQGGQPMQQPFTPSSEPGSGGGMAPGDFVPQQPPSPPPTSFLYNPDSLVASAARAFFNFLVSGGK